MSESSSDTLPPARAGAPQAARPHDDGQLDLARAVRQARSRLHAPGGFGPLAAQLTPRMRRYFRSHWFSAEDAEDLAQEVVARVWRGLPRLQDEEKFLAWALAVARNVRFSAGARLREERRWLDPGGVPADDVADQRSTRLLDHGRDAERREVVRAAIQALPPQQRRCLLLRTHEELSYEEISGALRLSVHTVRNHLAAARRSLRERLRAGEPPRRAAPRS